MIFLLLSIVSSALIFIIFKWLGRLRVSTFLVIVINYLVAGFIGVMITGIDVILSSIHETWFKGVVSLGAIFPAMFYLMAVTTHKVGAATASVTNKMSVVIPVTAAFFLYHDDPGFLKFIGIALALLGIFLASIKQSKLVFGVNALLLLLLFIGSGSIDVIIKYLQDTYLENDQVLAFTTVLFLAAAGSGLLIVLLRTRKYIQEVQSIKISIGLLLGTINFGSIYFLVMALQHTGMQSSVLFPVNNIGVVVLSTILSVIIFREQLSKKNYLGISLSIVALLVLMWA